MNPRRTAKITLKSSWQLAHDRAIQTTEQVKVVTHAQESKIPGYLSNGPAKKQAEKQ